MIENEKLEKIRSMVKNLAGASPEQMRIMEKVAAHVFSEHRDLKSVETLVNMLDCYDPAKVECPIVEPPLLVCPTLDYVMGEEPFVVPACPKFSMLSDKGKGMMKQVAINKFNGSFQDFFIYSDHVEKKVRRSTTLRRAYSQMTMTDQQLIANLGGIRKSLTSLWELWSLLVAQPLKNGDRYTKGVLCNNKRANVFFIPQLVRRVTASRFSFETSKSPGPRTVFEDVTHPEAFIKIGKEWYIVRVVHVTSVEDGWSIESRTFGTKDFLLIRDYLRVIYRDPYAR